MHLDDFLIAAVIVLAVTAVCVSFSSRLGLGGVLGFLAAGAIVGPFGFEVTTQVEKLRNFAEIGVVLFLFIIGLEMEPRRLWAMRHSVFGFGTAQVAATGVVIAAVALALGTVPEVAIVVGLGLALSSTAFVLQMLNERGELMSEHGQATFSVLLLQDLAIVPLLALVPLLSGAGIGGDGEPLWQRAAGVAGVIAGVVVFGLYVVPWALAQTARRRNMEAFGIISMLAVLAAAWAMEFVHLSMALGAFLMGMLLSASPYRYQMEAAIEPFKGLFIGLFFIAVGMSINFGVVLDRPLEALGLVLLIMAIKVAVLLALGFAFRMQWATVLRVAFLLPQCGEFGFVLFGAAKATGLIGSFQFAVLLLFISLSMLLTPLMAKLGYLLANRVAERAQTFPALPVHIAGVPVRHVIVAGYGRVGRIVCCVLERTGTPYVAFDVSPERVAVGRLCKHNVKLGSVTSPAILRAAGASSASAIVVTLRDLRDAERVVSTVHTFYPELSVHMRVPNLLSRDIMLRKGVSHAIPITLEGSLQLGMEVAMSVGVTEADAIHILDTLRLEDYAPLRLPSS